MNNPQSWPIRVGGEYRSVFGLTKRVTAIVGDKVHFLYLDGDCSDGVCSVETFRDLHHPQDQSPLPDLIAALEGVYAGCVNSSDGERLVLNISVATWKAVETALAKVKTAAVPHSEEVAA